MFLESQFWERIGLDALVKRSPNECATSRCSSDGLTVLALNFEMAVVRGQNVSLHVTRRWALRAPGLSPYALLSGVHSFVYKGKIVPVVEIDPDLTTGRKLSCQKGVRERRFQKGLNGAFERPSAVNRIKTDVT